MSVVTGFCVGRAVQRPLPFCFRSVSRHRASRTLPRPVISAFQPIANMLIESDVSPSMVKEDLRIAWGGLGCRRLPGGVAKARKPVPDRKYGQNRLIVTVVLH